MNLPPPQPAGQPAPQPAPQLAWAPPRHSHPQPAITAASLFDDDAALGTAITTATEQPLAQLTPALRKAALREVRSSLGESLGFPLADVVAQAWTRHKTLLAAAERTREKGREVVALADHTITSVHRPRIDLAVDGLPLASITVTLDLSVRVVGVAGVVEKAALVGLESGATTVTATLKIDGQQVAKRQHQFDARRLVTLDRPCELLPRPAG